MTVYVVRSGQLVEKRRLMPLPAEHRSDFPSPRLSRFDPMESPVTGETISSWRQRDRDMDAAGAVDPRDLPPPTKGRASHGRKRSEPDSAPFEWGKLS